MEAKLKKRYEAKARIMKALSHPTRLFILDQLFEQARCVCDLTKMIGHDISTVSKHLSVLRNAGIVTDQKKGTQVFYVLRIPCVLEFLKCAEKVLKANADELASAATV